MKDTPADLLPLRMVNEFAYCPRLFHLMHVQGRWEDNQYTIEGRTVHQRVDRIDHVLPDVDRGEADAEPATQEEPTDGDPPPDIARSVPLSSELLGVSAKLDLVATADEHALPVETKRGRVPDNPQRSYEPERVQLMAQGLLLREHGYHCDHGVLYFAGSRTRVDIPFTDELEYITRQYIKQAHIAAADTTLPDPLENSPKCNGCSLAGICLPDETLTLRACQAEPEHQPDSQNENADTPQHNPRPVRRFYPARQHATPLYIQEQGAVVGKAGQCITVKKKGEKIASARLNDTSQLVLCGNIMVTQQAVHLLCEAAVPIVHLSSGHWFYGITHGLNLRNAYDRAAQFQAAADPARCLQFAKAIVTAKALNQRTMLRRNVSPAPDSALSEIKQMVARVEKTTEIASLLGLEGMAAKHYFQNFAKMIRPRDFDADWQFTGRNKRPPRDPVNALLSFGYAMLAKEYTTAALADGLDPWWGLYHQPRHGRPALALDLMEPLRPLIVDSAVITAINTQMITVKDFNIAKAGCILKPAGRKAFIKAYEARLDQLVTHPIFDYRTNWRNIIRIQTRLFARWLRNDIPQYQPMTTR